MANYIQKIRKIKNQFGKFNSSEVENVLNVLNNDKIDYVKRLENLFCKKFKIKYSIACNSGTSALHSSLAALELPRGSEIIVPSLAVVMDAYAAIHCNLKPVFADVDENTFLVTAETISKKITKKTKAIIVVSLQGLPVDIDPIIKLAKKNNLYVIQDNAQEMLGRYKNKISGTTGDISIWSFENKKHLSGATEGGIIATNNKKLAMKIRKFAGIGYKNMTATGGRTSLKISSVQDPYYKRFDTIGLNYRMPQIVASVCYSQLSSVKFIVNRRIQVANLFRKAIKNCKWIIEQKIHKYVKHTHYTFAFKYLGKEYLNVSWKDFYKKYKSFGGDGFYSACVPINLEPAIVKYFKKNCPSDCKFKITRHKCQCINKESIPNAFRLQKQIMQFKTNYRNLHEAKKKASILKKVINYYEKKYKQ